MSWEKLMLPLMDVLSLHFPLPWSSFSTSSTPMSSWLPPFLMVHNSCQRSILICFHYLFLQLVSLFWKIGNSRRPGLNLWATGILYVIPLYISSLGQIILSQQIHVHFYADDTQLYVPIKADDTSQIMKVETCLYAVKKWMSENILLLISEKNEMLVIGPARQRHHFYQVTVILDNCVIY